MYGAYIPEHLTTYLAGRQADAGEVENLKKEINELREVENDSAKEIWQLKAQLKAERECVDWYADPDNWWETPHRNNLYEMIVKDADHVPDTGLRFGGKRAREQQSKRSEK
jgi:hypothetical protein